MSSVYPESSGEVGRVDPPSIGERLGDVTRDLSTLMRFFLLLFLSIALWWAIGNELGRGWAALIVAVLWGIIAAVLAVLGRNELRRVNGAPQTADTLGKIPNALKGQEENNQ